jgi:hypothetical protein
MAAVPPGPIDLRPNALVNTLGREGPESLPRELPLEPELAARLEESLADLAHFQPEALRASESPDTRYFAGYLGATFPARGELWCVFYLDLAFRTWLLVQTRGVLSRQKSQREPGTPGELDVLWVKADAAVCSGSDTLSLEGLFLIGHFTRAGDFTAESLPGGTQAAGGGGYGLAGQSPPRCCGKTNRRP